MSDAPTPEAPPDPHHGLTADLYRVAVFKLHQLPPPGIDDPELIAQFVNAGIAEIASMCPVNAEETGIAVRVVVADAQAADCIRHARTLFNDPLAAMKCHAQANHYMRTANAARSLLLRVQAVRHKREAVPATCNQDAWTIHATEGFLTAAAKGDPVQEPPPPVEAEDDNKFARYTEAEQYAVLHPRRAAEIRAYGGLPPTARYGVAPETVQLLITSDSPLLRQIDQEYAQAAAA